MHVHPFKMMRSTFPETWGNHIVCMAKSCTQNWKFLFMRASYNLYSCNLQVYDACYASPFYMVVKHGHLIHIRIRVLPPSISLPEMYLQPHLGEVLEWAGILNTFTLLKWDHLRLLKHVCCVDHSRCLRHPSSWNCIRHEANQSSTTLQKRYLQTASRHYMLVLTSGKLRLNTEIAGSKNWERVWEDLKLKQLLEVKHTQRKNRQWHTRVVSTCNRDLHSIVGLCSCSRCCPMTQIEEQTMGADPYTLETDGSLLLLSLWRTLCLRISFTSGTASP